MKQIQLRPRIAEHDLQTKICTTRRLLIRDRVKIQVFFRGREIAHTSIGSNLLDRVVEATKDIARVETRIEKDSSYFIILVKGIEE